MASIRGHEVPVPSKVPIRKDAISALISMPGFRGFLQFLNVFSNFPSTGTNTFCWNQSHIIFIQIRIQFFFNYGSGFMKIIPVLIQWIWIRNTDSSSRAYFLYYNSFPGALEFELLNDCSAAKMVRLRYMSL